MDQQRAKRRRQARRRHHVRNHVRGTAERPRLTVFRSNKHTYAQIINDDDGQTLVAASSLASDAVKYGGNKAAATNIGTLIAEAAKAKGIQKVAFDRGHYKYHGRVQALADAARKGGLQF